MPINSEFDRYNSLLTSIGKATLHSLFPNDFEYYLIALELVNSNDNVEDFLIFPILPDEIRERESYNKTIMGTASGVTILGNSKFNPIDISLRGSFGKRLKLLLGRGILDGAAFNFFSKPIFSGFKKELTFSNEVKSGYGCNKILESLLRKSTKVDANNNPYRLHYYNLAFNSVYVVEAMDSDFNQTLSTNMIWNYSVNLKAVAPLKALIGKSTPNSINKLMAVSIINKQANKEAYKVLGAINSKVNAQQILNNSFDILNKKRDNLSENLEKFKEKYKNKKGFKSIQNLKINKTREINKRRTAF